MVGYPSYYLLIHANPFLGAVEEQRRRVGDKRADPKISNLSLKEAMRAKYGRDLSSNPSYQNLGMLLYDLKSNPDNLDFDRTALNALVKELLEDTLQSAHVLATTAALALRPAIYSVIQRIIKHLVMDECAKTPIHYALGLIAIYVYVKLIWPAGDTLQLRPYWITATNIDFPEPFGQTGRESLLSKLATAGWKMYELMEQFRIWDVDFVKFLSVEFYQGRLVDGNLGKPLPKVAKVVRQHLKNAYNIPQGSVVFFLTENSKSHRGGGTSIANPGHQFIVKEIAKRLLADVDASELLTQEEKDAFTIRHLNPYTLQKDYVDLMFREMGDPRLRSSTGHACQSVQDSFVILELPNDKNLSKFLNEEGLLTVMCTRQKYGLAIVWSGMAFDHKQYRTMKSEYDFIKKFPKLAALDNFAKIQRLKVKWVASISQ
jgi:hypothetical protein